MEWYIYIIAVFCGLLAGFINTLAGSGSLLTLPVLIFLGLPANIANGTNRIGVLLQSLIGVLTFKQKVKIDMKRNAVLLIVCVTGAMFGANIAIDIDENSMRYVIGVVMIIMLFPVLFNADKWLSQKTFSVNKNLKVPLLLLFFFIGIFGGFVQAGVGILLLVTMVMLAGYNVNESNALKNLIVFCYTIPAIIIFIINDQINWKLGGLLAIGQVSGAYIAARFATKHKNAGIWIRKLLIFIILISIIELFGIRKILFILME